MRPAIRLIELNDIDLLVDVSRTRLAEIAEALKEPEALRSARKALTQVETEQAQLRARQQAAELAQNKVVAKLARDEQRLYGGKVHSPKELEDLQADVQQSHRQRSQCEDELLEILIALESADERQVAARAALAHVMAEWEATQTRLRGEQARLTQRLAGEQTRQAGARAAVPAQYLTTYDALRPRRGGRAVARIDGDACSACRVAVSPTKVEAARYGDELVFCENCGRMLFGE